MRPAHGFETGRFHNCIKTLVNPRFFTVDEIGDVSATQSGPIVFFELINGQYGRTSNVLTSNRGFEEWVRNLGDKVIAAALLDCLLHFVHIVDIQSNCNRIRRYAKLSNTFHLDAEYLSSGETMS